MFNKPINTLNNGVLPPQSSGLPVFIQPIQPAVQSGLPPLQQGAPLPSFQKGSTFLNGTTNTNVAFISSNQPQSTLISSNSNPERVESKLIVYPGRFAAPV